MQNCKTKAASTKKGGKAAGKTQKEKAEGSITDDNADDEDDEGCASSAAVRIKQSQRKKNVTRLGPEHV